MEGIVSLLDEEHTALVENLWQVLENDCGLTGISVTPIAHFSWQVAEDYDIPLVKQALQEIAAAARPFTLRTTGLGVFSGERPVLYVNIVKDDLLLEMHKMVWQRTLCWAINPSPFYAPSVWVPHITLAHGDVVPVNVKCALDLLVFRPFNWEVSVDNIALISQANGVGEERLHFEFSGD